MPMKRLSDAGGNCASTLSATLSATLAGVCSATNGNQIWPSVTMNCNIQTQIQRCQPPR